MGGFIPGAISFCNDSLISLDAFMNMTSESRHLSIKTPSLCLLNNVQQGKDTASDGIKGRGIGP